MPRPRLALPPVTVFLLQRAGYAFAFSLWSTYAQVRRAVDLGFDPLELVLVGTVLEASVFLFEVPTGVVADVYSRRRSIRIGYATIAAGFALEAASSGFLGILAAQVVWGVGWTFLSGARSSWLADEIGAETAGPVYLRAAQLGQAAALLGIVVSAFLATGSLVWPLWAGAGAMGATAILVSLSMAETGFRPLAQGERGSFAAMAGTFRAGVAHARRSAVVGVLLVVALFNGAGSEGFDRLMQLHFLVLTDYALPALGPFAGITWFAAMSGVSLALGIVVLAIARRRVARSGLAQIPRMLAALQAVLVAASLLFALAGSFPVALGAWWAAGVMRMTMNPLQTAWAQRGLDSRVRATVISMLGQADSLGQTLMGPGLGLLGRARGVRAALVVSTLLFVPGLGMLARAARKADIDAGDPT